MHKLYNNKYFLLLIIVFLSALTIFFEFPSTPKHIAFDELEFAKLALSLEGKPYTPYSPQATGHTTLYYYLILFSFKIFGISNFSLRLISALSGVLSAAVFFLLLEKLLKNKKAAFISSFILISLRWFFNFPRFGFEASFLFFLELTALFFLIDTIEKKDLIRSFLSGVFTALAYNSYASGRIFPFLMLSLLLIFLKNRKINLKQALTFFLAMFIISLPLNFYYLYTPDLRAKQLIFLFDKNLSFSEKLNFFLQNLKSYALFFAFRGDWNGKHNFPYKPALNPFINLLLLWGALIAIKNFKKVRNLIFLVWFLFSLVPSLFIYPWENPSMLRTYPMLASIAYFSTLGFLNIEKRIWKFRFILYILLILSFLYELRTYFYYQKRMVLDHAFEIPLSLEELQKKDELKLPSKIILKKYGVTN